MIEIIDIHCHLTFKQYDEDREKVIKDAKMVLQAVVVSGTEPEDSEKALRLAAEHEGFIFVTAGLHPIHVEELSDKDIERYQEFIAENKRRIIGIGEIGLDYHWIKEPLKIRRTKEVFLEFLRLAKELDLPVVLHLRNAVEEGFKLVVDEDIRKAVFHCYTGKPQLASEIWDEGYYISLPTSIVRSKTMKKVAKIAPLSLLLAETDAPYLSPFEGEERNVPQNVRVVYEKIAEQKKTDVESLDTTLLRNFEELFGVTPENVPRLRMRGKEEKGEEAEGEE